MKLLAPKVLWSKYGPIIGIIFLLCIGATLIFGNPFENVFRETYDYRAVYFDYAGFDDKNGVNMFMVTGEIQKPGSDVNIIDGTYVLGTKDDYAQFGDEEQSTCYEYGSLTTNLYGEDKVYPYFIRVEK